MDDVKIEPLDSLVPNTVEAVGSENDLAQIWGSEGLGEFEPMFLENLRIHVNPELFCDVIATLNALKLRGFSDIEGISLGSDKDFIETFKELTPVQALRANTHDIDKIIFEVVKLRKYIPPKFKNNTRVETILNTKRMLNQFENGRSRNTLPCTSGVSNERKQLPKLETPTQIKGKPQYVKRQLFLSQNSSTQETPPKKVRKKRRNDRLIPLDDPRVDILFVAQTFAQYSATLMACIANNYSHEQIRDFLLLGLSKRRSTKKGQLGTCRSVLEFILFLKEKFPESPVVGDALAIPLVKFFRIHKRKGPIGSTLIQITIESFCGSISFRLALVEPCGICRNATFTTNITKSRPARPI